ncbi:MAG: geranylgeranyl reductase family protein [Nitriliruptor sp.]|nr:MAG: geranylgeranyl reductase family protein [Nitriliruptor sp.]TVR23120.1 MAG: geranylgeranyl reductase family protein [Nitriliruptor sp.]
MAIADTVELGPTERADVVVVGAGPGGSAAAAHLAARGRDVVVLEKDTFPRDKVCGDGLTPRVIRELLDLGLEDEAHGRAPGFKRNRGLRINGGHTTMELPWPELDDWPNWGGCSTRMVFDETIARTAVRRGAALAQGHAATRPLWRDPAESRVTGVAWKARDGREGQVLAPVVIAADGAGGPMAKHLGVHRRPERPMAVAARGYYRSPRSHDEWISSYLDLTDADGNLLSGYGWVFPLDDGTMNVGLGLLSTSREYQAVNYRKLLESWATGMAADGWGTDASALEGPIRTGPIPMGFNHTPLHQRGVLLVGDSGGMVNPFNGEGISYAMEAAQLAAEVVDAALVTRRTSDLERYDRELRRRIGGYYTLGRVFAELVGNPTVMHVCTTYGMPYRPLMLLVLKLMAHLTDQTPADTKDVIVNTLQRLAPAA